MKSYPKAKGSKRSNRGKPTGRGIGSPLGHRGINGAYGKPMAMKPPGGRKAGRKK